MYNKVIVMGRITHDLELKTTPTGVSVLSFSIAVDRNYQPKGEERKSDFFNVVAWRNTAEFVHKYFGKGCMVLVDGELQTRQYTNKDNVTVTVTEIVADSVNFTGEKREPQAYGGQPQQSSAGTANSYGSQAYSQSQGNATYSTANQTGYNPNTNTTTVSGGYDDYPF